MRADAWVAIALIVLIAVRISWQLIAARKQRQGKDRQRWVDCE